MHGMEIHTAVQYRLPITFLLFNNNAHAMCVTREQLFYDDQYSYNRFGPSRLGAGLGRDVPRAALGRRRATSTSCRPPWRRRWTPTARRWSASSAPPTKSRHSHRFSASRHRNHHEQPSFDHKGEPLQCRCPRLTTSPPTGTTDPIDGVIRIETSPQEKATPIIMEMMRSVYPHDEVFGEYCTVNDYIDCPPDELFDYMADTRSLEEWTYSLRGFTPTEEPGLWLAYDKLGGPTEPDLHAHRRQPRGATVDYHCAWDQGKHLWMIYLMRVVDAQVVFDKPGSVVLWTNCHHPFYDHNPYPETAPPKRPVWVGDFWDMFGAGHLLELKNLKAIAEYRHHNGLPVTPDWMR